MSSKIRNPLALIAIGPLLSLTLLMVAPTRSFEGTASPARTPAAIHAAAVARSLSRAGNLLWSFESLLHRTFGSDQPSVVSARARGPLNFVSCGRTTCSPLSRYLVYTYTFTGHGRTRLRLSSRSVQNRNFGNYAELVLIRGHAIACARKGRRFLVTTAAAASFTLICAGILS